MKHMYWIGIVVYVVLFTVSCLSPQFHYRNIPLKRQQIVKTATSYLGIPYKRGGTNPSGFDCSGYVYFVYEKNGIQIPRSIQQQYINGYKIPYRMAQPGDLLFFRIDKSEISHVGIFVGDNTFVHAPSSGKHVRYDSITNPYWKKRFCGVVTYFKDVPKKSFLKQGDSYREERFVW